MKVTGIIAEYNPFHNGHEYQIKEARRLGADYIVVVMSGDFTQRGEPAIYDKHLRCQMALEAGADLVIELPVIYATAPANRFARGGVELLHRLGIIDELIFGIEEGCEELCFKLADFLSDPPADYDQKIHAFLKSGLSYPTARSKALTDYFSEDELVLLSASNMILAIEYIQALKELGSNISPHPITRIGAAYNDNNVNSDGISSASGIRNIIMSGDTRLLDANIPARLTRLYKEGLPLCSDDFSSILHYKLITENDFTPYLDVEQNFSDRLNATKADFTSFEAYADILKSKNITRTSVVRLLTHIMLDIKTDIPHQLPYARILGFRRDSKDLFAMIKKKAQIELISKLADAGPNDCLNTDIQAAKIYNLILTSKTGQVQKSEYERGIVII